MCVDGGEEQRDRKGETCEKGQAGRSISKVRSKIPWGLLWCWDLLWSHPPHLPVKSYLQPHGLPSRPPP